MRGQSGSNPDISMNKQERREISVELKVEPKHFVTYDEGAARYSMSKSSFIKLAAEAHAVYKRNRIVLVNTVILEEYLEVYRV